MVAPQTLTLLVLVRTQPPLPKESNVVETTNKTFFLDRTWVLKVIIV